jgi:transposase
MNKIRKSGAVAQEVFIGIDVHEHSYSVSVFFEKEELQNHTYPSDTRYLKKLLERYSSFRIQAVYEAGPFGYTLYEWLQSQGVQVIVTPPSKIPEMAGDFVKTDKRDARKLAQLLSGGLLKSVSVPDRRKREDRDLVRTRDQQSEMRRRIFLQIGSKLRFHGIPIRCRRLISAKNRKEIAQYPGMSTSLRTSLDCLLADYDHYTKALQRIRREVVTLSEDPAYRDALGILQSIPGVGLLTALNFILELPDMRKFANNEHVGSYLGLTSCEYSSGEHRHQGHITRCGNARIRKLLVQCAWRLIGGDAVMKRCYERIKRRRGGKRAIVALARKLSGRMRTILLRKEPYQVGLVQ